MPREVDVVVVGAGLAGLTAAWNLREGGLEPLVLEARERVGGRTLSEPIGDGAVVEMGGQWLASDNERMHRLAGLAGIPLFMSYSQGTDLLEISGKPRKQRGQVPPLRPAALIDVAIARSRLDRLVASVPLDEPWRAPGAAKLDELTMRDWLDRTVHSKEARALLDVAFTTLWASVPEGINLLQALEFIGSVGKFDKLTAPKYRVTGGAWQIPQWLAAELGDQVVLRAPVSAILRKGEGVEVESAHGTVRARRVVVAVPPVLASDIRFEPRLPHSREVALRSVPPGSITKVSAVYQRPFWREQGLSGRSTLTRGPLTATFDNSPDGDDVPGVLVGFVPGDRAHELAARPEAERRRVVLDAMVRMFGPRAAAPEAYFEKDWTADPWSRGGYFGIPAPGAMLGSVRYLRDPEGPVHWAGSETTMRDNGGMEGAVASGERAAAEVLASVRTGVGQHV